MLSVQTVFLGFAKGSHVHVLQSLSAKKDFWPLFFTPLLNYKENIATEEKAWETAGKVFVPTPLVHPVFIFTYSFLIFDQKITHRLFFPLFLLVGG